MPVWRQACAMTRVISCQFPYFGLNHSESILVTRKSRITTHKSWLLSPISYHLSLPAPTPCPVGMHSCNWLTGLKNWKMIGTWEQEQEQEQCSGSHHHDWVMTHEFMTWDVIYIYGYELWLIMTSWAWSSWVSKGVPRAHHFYVVTTHGRIIGSFARADCC